MTNAWLFICDGARRDFSLVNSHFDFLTDEGGEMKILLAGILTLASFGFVGTWNSGSVANAAALGNPQVQIRIGRQRRRDRDWDRARGDRIGYVRTFTRDVRHGFRLYRETYRVRYLPNGRTQTMLISRVRLN